MSPDDTRTAAYHEAWLKVMAAATAGDPEDALNALGDWLEVDAKHQENALVRSCLESAAENARHAALDYYASTK